MHMPSPHCPPLTSLYSLSPLVPDLQGRDIRESVPQARVLPGGGWGGVKSESSDSEIVIISI